MRTVRAIANLILVLLTIRQGSFPRPPSGPGPTAQLAFTTSPSNSMDGTPFETPPVVMVEDAGHNPLTSSTASITLASGTNPSSGALNGTTTANAVSSVTAFSNLSVNKAGNGYTLTASSNGLAG